MLDQEILTAAIPQALDGVKIEGLGEKQTGKVRDMYTLGDRRLLITTDRISAFDRVLSLIPFKGQVLNQLSAWWFDQTQDLIANHKLAVPDPNVMIVKEAETLPVEVVVRGFITGVTDTSLWTLYSQGQRQIYGLSLPEGLQKNDPLPQPVITPTTKAAHGQHDRRLDRQEIIDTGIVEAQVWEKIEETALALFQRGQAIAEQAGLNLVDTKYEFGLLDGELTLIDEFHTPDSSRFWMAGGHGPDGIPDHYDKEYMRMWFAKQGYRGDGPPPEMPAETIVEVARRYIGAYERLTGEQFSPAEIPAEERIRKNLSGVIKEWAE